MGLSFGEIIVIVLVAFLVLGPDKLRKPGAPSAKPSTASKSAVRF